MHELTFTCSTWHQGQYSGGTYTDNSSFIASDAVEIPFGIQSISCSGEDNQTVWLKQYHAATTEHAAYFDDPYLSTGTGIAVCLLDKDRNQLVRRGLTRGSTVDVSSYPTARYAIIEIEAASTSVMYLWSIRPDEASCVSTGNRCICRSFEFGITYLRWEMYTDGFPRYEDADLFPSEFIPPLPDSHWRIVNDVPTNMLMPQAVTPFVEPIPKAHWRLDEYHNNGFPWNELIPDIPYNPPRPVTPVKQRPYICLFRFDTPQDGFDTHGMFVLTPTSCKITEELNGRYEISMEHPIDAEGRWQYIRENYIIKAMGQLFTIRTVQQVWKGSSGKIVAKGDHIWYQIGDRWLKKTEGETSGISSKYVRTLVSQMHTQLDDAFFTGDTHYAFYPTIQQDLQVPDAIGSARWQHLDAGFTPVEFFLGSNGIIQASGAQIYRDNFDFTISERKADSFDNAFDIRVGKNMTGIKRTIDVSSLVTYVMGYVDYTKNGTTDLRQWYGVSWVNSDLADYGIPHHIYREKEFKYNIPVNYWYSVNPPMTIVEAMFKQDVELWFSQNCQPLIAYEIDMKDLQNNPDYQMFADLDSFRVGNYGYIHDENIGDIEIGITKTTVNAITGETEQVTFGNVRSFVGQPPQQLVIDPDTAVVVEYFQVQDSEGAYCFDRNGDMIVEMEGV